MKIYLFMFSLITAVFCQIDNHFMPTKCEVCALFSMELNQQVSRIYKRQSSDFADLTEDLCKKFNEFNIHKEKTGLERFSRQPSKTMETLRQIKDKGVQVELGMPYEMWSQPSAEIFALRQGCDSILEEYEDLIEDWFLKKNDLDDLLIKLCQNKVLNGKSTDCLPISKQEL